VLLHENGPFTVLVALSVGFSKDLLTHPRIKARRELKELLAEKKRRRREEEERDLKGIKNEAEAWKYINKKRGKREWIQNNIKKKEWENHFMELLEGTKRKEMRAEEVKHSRRGEKEEKITEGEEELENKEIARAVGRMKKKKAAGCDGIPMEAWMRIRRSN